MYAAYVTKIRQCFILEDRWVLAAVRSSYDHVSRNRSSGVVLFRFSEQRPCPKIEVPFDQFSFVRVSSVQGRTYAPGKTRIRSASSVRGFPIVVFIAVPMLVWLIDWHGLSVYLSVSVSVYLSLSLCVYLSLCVCLSVSVSPSLSSLPPSLHLSLSLSVSLSVSLSASLSDVSLPPPLSLFPHNTR